MNSKVLTVLKDIMYPQHNSNMPQPNDNRWEPVPDKEYKIIKDTNYYNITSDLIKMMEKYTKIYNTLNDTTRDLIINPTNNHNIATVYIAENDTTAEKYVGYTTNPMTTFIRLNIHSYNLDQESVFDNFEYSTDFNKNKKFNLTDFSFETIEYVKYNNRQDILDRKRQYTKTYVNNNEPSPSSTSPKNKILIDTNKIAKSTKDDSIDKLYNKRIDIFYDILRPQEKQFKPFVGYIYDLNLNNNNNKNANKSFIIGYNHKLSKKFVFDQLSESDTSISKDIQDLGRKDYTLTLLETFHSKSMYDLLFRTDYWIIKKDSIANGYNHKYNMSESEILFGPNLLTRRKNQVSRSIFLNIQKFLLNKNFDDNLDYTDIYGMIYQIQNKKTKERFISYAYNKKFKNILLDYYNTALKGNIKKNKLLKALMEIPYDDFTYSILKIKNMDDKKIDILDETEKLVSRFKTVDKGYNANKNS